MVMRVTEWQIKPLFIECSGATEWTCEAMKIQHGKYFLK